MRRSTSRTIAPPASDPGALGAAATADPAASGGREPAVDGGTPGLVRIHDVAELVGLTPRSIRYYEEMGLLRPSARSQGAYRLYDESDIERLRFIKGLRDDAGFSLAEIGRLLEEEGDRQRAREAFRATDDPVERRRIIEGRLVRIDAQVATLHSKIGRLQAMVGEAKHRRARLETLLAGLEDAE